MYDEGITGAVGRVVGIHLKDKIIKQITEDQYDKVVLDFSRVDFVTSGFAKELFCGLYSEYKENFSSLFSIRVGENGNALKQTIIRAMSGAIS